MKARGWIPVLTCLAVGLAAALTGCGGDRAPTVKIVSDLPLQGSDIDENVQMAWAIEHVIEKEYDGHAGDFRIEFESTDNSTEAAGTWDPGKCVDNAHSHVSDEAVVGVIGTANSGCSEYEIPILNRANLAMVSPADTFVGLTKPGPGTVPGQPQRYYPSGKRSFLRLVPSDDYQGRAGAVFMKSRGVTKVYVLDDGGLYGKGVAGAFTDSAMKLGLRVRREGWDMNVRKYTALITRIKKSRAEAVYVGGTFAKNGRRLIHALLDRTARVELLVSDGSVSSSIAAEGTRGEALFGTFPATRATASGRRLRRALVMAEPNAQVEPYMVYAAAAAEVLLDAIGRSNGTRQDVIKRLFETKELDTVVGPMTFDDYGDPECASTTGYTVYRAEKGVWRRVRGTSVHKACTSARP